ncbi:unnamed protein product [Sphagnum tenellum]
MMSAPQETTQWSYANFTRRVKDHMLRGPFANLLGETNVKLLQLRKESAYLYDAVKLYAWSLAKVLRENLGEPDERAMGYQVFMDCNGDAEGNYTLLALNSDTSDAKGLFPVGSFLLDSNGNGLPILRPEQEPLLDEGKAASRRSHMRVPERALPAALRRPPRDPDGRLRRHHRRLLRGHHRRLQELPLRAGARPAAVEGRLQGPQGTYT